MLLDGNENVDSSSAEKQVTEALEGAGATREPEQQPELPPAPEPPKDVSLTPTKTRRQRIEEQYNGRLSEMAESVKKLSEGMAERDRRIGELTGHLSALANRPAYQPPPMPQQQGPQIPDPEELERKALDALDRKDMTGYVRLTREASVAASVRAMMPALQQRQQYQAPPQETIPPQLMTYFAAYPEVASHPNAMQLLAAKNVELEARGFAKGPERVKAIFDEVKSVVTAGRQSQGPQFSQASAGALAGVPTSRPQAGAGARSTGEPRVQLTPEEQRMFKALGADEAKMARIIAESHPERIVR